MENLKQTIENSLYSYDMNEFTPIWRDGRLDNRAEFALYKAGQFAEQLGHLASRTLTVATTAGAVLLEGEYPLRASRRHHAYGKIVDSANKNETAKIIDYGRQ